MNAFKDSMAPIAITALMLFPAGFIVGSLVSDDTASSTNTSQTETTEDHAAAHGHEKYEVLGDSAPAIDMFHVEEDAKAGWNLQLMTSNFKFAPDNASGDHVEGEGHAHLYIDGEKVTRLYSPNFYIDHLEEGEHTIRVTLNTNDHKEYAISEKTIEATQTISDAHHAEDDSEESHDAMESDPHTN